MRIPLKYFDEQEDTSNPAHFALAGVRYLEDRIGVLEHWMKELNQREESQMLPKEFLSVRDVARYLSLSEGTIYEWCAEKRIPHLKLGSRTLFDPEELEKWIESKRVIPKV